MSDDYLRRSYARHHAGNPAPGRWGCAPPEKLLALVERQGTDAERMETLDHAMACEACRKDLELLRAVTRSGRQMAGAGGRWAPVRRLWAQPRWMAAAAVLVIALGSLTVTLLPRGPESAWRAAGAEANLVSPRGAVPRGAPLTFTWRREPAATFYELELLGPAGEALHLERTADTTLALPPNVSLTTGTDYTWVVRVRLEDGRSVHSDPVRFRLTQP